MKILLPTDGSRYALAAARAISGWFAWPGGTVDVLAVLPGEAKSGHRDYGQDTSRAADWRATVTGWVEATERHLDGSGLAVAGLVRDGDPVAVALEVAAQGGYDLVAVGAKGRAEEPRLVEDAVARALLERAPTSVLLVRERTPRGPRRRLPTRQRPLRVVLGVDGRGPATDAARRYARMVAADHVRATLVTAADATAGGPLAMGDAVVASRRAAAMLAAAGLEAEAVVRTGSAAGAILSVAAQEEADLIVLGARASVEGGTYLGSVGLEVARAAPCSVLLAREARPSEVAEAEEEPGTATPFEIAYEGIEPSPVVDRYVLRGLRRLERAAPDLMRARVTVGERQRRRRTGDLYDVRLELMRPGENVVVSRTPPRHRESEDLPTAIGEAFAKARRMVVERHQEERGDVKAHEEKHRGVVTELFPDYGFLRGDDGRVVYFHRNSVLGGDWDDVEAGDEVRFVDEPGEQGPQATTVTVSRGRLSSRV